MKAFLRKIVRMMASWPFVGRLVRIVVAVIRLPQFRDQYEQRLNAMAPSTLSSPHSLPPELKHSWDQFGALQLPTLLQAISDLNHRQIAAENEHDNLRKSAPVALRKLTRDVAELRNQIGQLTLTTERLDADRPRLDTIDHRLHELQTELGGLRDELGGLRNEAAQLAQGTEQARNRADSVGDSIAFAVQRIEFVRRELMFELRYGAGASGADKTLSVSAEVLSQEKLDAARRTALRLNLGCGHIALDGYINVDRRALPGVDIVAEVNALPLEPGEADEIFSSHLLEHFPEEQLRRELLPYYNSLLKTGGVFRAVVPDAEAMIGHYAQGDYPYEDMREVLYGAQDYDGDFHFNMFTPASLSSLLVEAGFKEPKVIESGRKNGRCYEFEIVAEKQTPGVVSN
jgi:predicted SAM-dependent methyltransferase